MRLAVWFILLCASAHAAIVTVHSTGLQGFNSTGVTLTIPATTAGNTYLVGYSHFGSTDPTATVLVGSQACTKDVSFLFPAAYEAWFRCSNMTGGDTALHVNNVTGGFVMYSGMEKSGMSNTGQPIGTDSTGAVVGPGTTWTTGSFTPTSGQNAIILAFAANWTNSLTLLSSSPYVDADTGVDGAGDYGLVSFQLVSSTSGSYTPHGTLGPQATVYGLGVAYQASSGAPAVAPRHRASIQ